MPIYEYECGACSDIHEFIQKFSDGPKRKCPSCGKLRLRKLISAAAFHLKGDGWYVTDFRDKGKDKGKEKSDSDGSAGESKPDSKSDSKPDSKSPDSKSSDSKSSDAGSSSSKDASASKTDSGSGGSSQAP